MSLFQHIRRSLATLRPKARVRYFFSISVQTLISVLDLLGISLLLLVLSESTLNSKGSSYSSSISNLPVLHEITEFSRRHSLWMVATVVLLFSVKSFLGLFMNYFSIKNLSIETQEMSRKLIKILFRVPSRDNEKYSSHEITYVLNEGVRLAVLETLYPTAIIFADLVLFFVILFNLFFQAQVIFLPTIFFFCTLFAILNRVVKRLTQASFKDAYESEMESKSLIQETIFGSRELYARGASEFFTDNIYRARQRLSNANTKIAFSLLIPKYSYELGLFFGIGLIALISGHFAATDILFNVTLFVISSSRIVPALLRIQYYSALLGKAQAQTSIVFEILDENQDYNGVIESRIPTLDVFEPSIIVNNLSFTYPNHPEAMALRNISFTHQAGNVLAIVGKSGSGKSTLVDALVGFINPQSGEVLISGSNVRNIGIQWPGKIAYVPQNVTIFSGNIYSNVALGVDEKHINHERVKFALAKVGLLEFFEGLENGFSSDLGEFGSKLSGGQLQRLGIARALYSEAKILFFDESTSALDAQSEALIMNILGGFRHNKTIVLVTHRLSTLKYVDNILYLENGSLVKSGTLPELQMAIPDFAQQIELLHLQ